MAYFIAFIILAVLAVVFMSGYIYRDIKERNKAFPPCYDCGAIAHQDWIQNGSYNSYHNSTPSKCHRHSCNDCSEERNRARRLGVRGHNLSILGCEEHNQAPEWIPAQRKAPQRQ